MATHDYVIANGTGAAVRSDLNDALAAIVSQNSSATAPTTTYAYMPWADTATGLYKIRNAANNNWITLFKLDGTFTDITLSAQGDLRFADSDSSNWVAFQAPATVASNVTWTLPATDGTANQVLKTDGSAALGWATAVTQGTAITAGTAVASTSGTSIDFTSIPSWVKRVTVMFDGVSTNGTSIPIIQIGDSGGVETSGYTGAASIIGTGVVTGNYSSGLALSPSGQWFSTTVAHGSLVLTLLSSNTWSAIGTVGSSAAAVLYVTGGSKTLSATLDRVRITTAGGTDTFDAGTINILYEG